MFDRRPKWAYSLPVALILMAPFDLLASLAMDIYLPAVPVMPAELGTSPEIVQLTLSLYLLGLGLGQILFGPLSDRIGRRPVVLGGAAVFALASAILAMTSEPASFVALRLAQALGASAALVATFATVRDIYAERPETVTRISRQALSFRSGRARLRDHFFRSRIRWHGDRRSRS